MNSGEIGFILFIVLFIGFGILKVIRSGEGGEFLSFMKMMKQGQADAFEGESKTLATNSVGLGRAAYCIWKTPGKWEET